MFMGKILYKATSKVSLPIIFHLYTILLSPLHTWKFYLPPTEKYTTFKDKDQNVWWIQEFVLGCPWTPGCWARNLTDSLESSIEYHTASQSQTDCKNLRNTFSMHSPYSTQWYKLAREVPYVGSAKFRIAIFISKGHSRLCLLQQLQKCTSYVCIIVYDLQHITFRVLKNIDQTNISTLPSLFHPPILTFHLNEVS